MISATVAILAEPVQLYAIAVKVVQTVQAFVRDAQKPALIVKVQHYALNVESIAHPVWVMTGAMAATAAVRVPLYVIAAVDAIYAQQSAKAVASNVKTVRECFVKNAGFVLTV